MTTMRLEGEFLIRTGPMYGVPANDNLFGEADFVAGNLATTGLTAMLAATITIDEGVPF